MVGRGITLNDLLFHCMYLKKSEHGPQIPNAHQHRNNDDFVIEIKNGDWIACESNYLINFIKQSWKLKGKYRHPLEKGET